MGADETKETQSEWTEAKSRVFETKRGSEYFDPCQEFATRSIKCLHRNNGDRDMCSDLFQAYRDCKRQWQEDRKMRRISGKKESS